MEDQITKLIYNLRSPLKDAETKFAKGPPKQWWDEAMEDLEKCEEFETELSAGKFMESAKVAEALADYRQRAETLQAEYVSKVLVNEFQERLLL